MTITMNDAHMTSIAQLVAFRKAAEDIEFQGASRKEKYGWIETILLRFRYFSLRKKDKTVVKDYIRQMTGFSDAQTTRLIGRKKKWGKIMAVSGGRHRFAAVYTTDDVALPAETDLAHGRLSGPATKKIFEREYVIFGKKKFERLKNISVAHLYNLRGRRQYTSRTKFFDHTKPTAAAIGERRKPSPEGKPGYLRVDTVHQGDLEGEKGVYHVNIVDEVSQWEILGAVEKISEAYLAPLLEELIAQFPFRILGFHSDNGGEYINRVVAALLGKLLIDQTKSRARHCNDNALVEGKNGAVVRKHMGYVHISQRQASKINAFYRARLNVYLNYHRPCGFAATVTDARGKQKKIYETYLTPFEKLLGLPGASDFLKEGVTFDDLRKIANEKSDNECAALMQKAKQELFKTFQK